MCAPLTMTRGVVSYPGMTGFSVSTAGFPAKAPVPVEDLSRLEVFRGIKAKGSHMITRQIGSARPGETQRISGRKLGPVAARPSVPPLPSEWQTAPRRVVLTGRWLPPGEHPEPGENIFGRLGRFEVDGGTVPVPVPVLDATDGALGYYGGCLIPEGKCFQFAGKKPLLVATMDIGSRHVEDHLLPRGGGIFIEHHDLPHFHMALRDDCGGYLLLGKQTDAGCELSFFRLPCQGGIYTPPNVVHSDSFLVGSFIVVYGAPDDFSTVVLKTRSGERVKLVPEERNQT